LFAFLFVASDLVVRSQFLTGCLPESRLHFAKLKDGRPRAENFPKGFGAGLQPAA
jgi:hypothetical protein